MGQTDGEDYELLPPQHRAQKSWETRGRTGFLARLETHFLLALLLLSVLFNAMLVLGWISSRDELSGSTEPVWASSHFRREEAKGGFTREDTMWWNTNYSGENEREVSDLWHNDIPWESGIIAINKQEASELRLPESQSFPWDVTKAIYILNAHHILHCIVSHPLFLMKSHSLREFSAIYTSPSRNTVTIVLRVLPIPISCIV